MPDSEQYVSLPFMTVSEAAKYLGVGRKVVYQLIEWGEIRVIRMSGTAMIEKMSLDEYRASGKMN
ncbi:MAG: helix-turn-helix domain-containing protein [Syntrophobacteraceae bacterium]